MKRYALLTLFPLVVALAACGDEEFPYVANGGGELDPYVETPSDGDAVGREFEGQWGLELVWTACSGTCAIDTVFGVASVCDVGMIRQDRGEIRQSNGSVQIDMDGEELRFNGGVNADGTFDVLSVATQYGGELEIRVRSKGSISGFDLTAEASSHTVGEADGSYLNCWGTLEITGNSLD